MKIMYVATTAVALGAAPVMGVCPESFMSSLQRVMAVQAMEDVEGTISSISPDTSYFAIQKSDDEVMTVQVNDQTTYSLDGKASTREMALKVGRHAKITHKDKVATRVDVTSEK